MNTFIANQYTKLINELTTLFNDRTRFHNALEIEQNDDNFLKNGWAMAQGAINDIDISFCTIAAECSYKVYLTNESMIMPHSREDTTIATLLTAIGKLLFKLDALSASDVSVSEIKELLTEKSRFLFVEISFKIKTITNK